MCREEETLYRERLRKEQEGLGSRAQVQGLTSGQEASGEGWEERKWGWRQEGRAGEEAEVWFGGSQFGTGGGRSHAEPWGGLGRCLRRNSQLKKLQSTLEKS